MPKKIGKIIKANGGPPYQTERMKKLCIDGKYIKLSLIEVREFLRMPQLRHWDDLTPELREKLELRWVHHQNMGHIVQSAVGELLRKTRQDEVAATVASAEEHGF